MDLLMDGLLMAATLFAGGYCWVLARRVRELKSLDRGLGGAIVTLTRQIELARATLDDARAATKENRQDLTQLIGRAETAAGQLRLLLATVREAPPARAATAVTEAAPAALAFPDPVPAPVPPRPVLAAAVRAEPALAFDPPAPEAEASRPAPAGLGDVPKPRALPPLESPLRSRGRAAPAGSEDELIEALSALAAGGSR